MRKMLLPAALAALAAACAMGPQLIGPGRRDIAALYSVDPQRAWSAFEGGGQEVWTVDGPALQSVRFVKGLEPGKKLFGDGRSKAAPAYRTGLNQHQLMEFILDSLRSAGVDQVEASSLAPFDFGGHEGFRIDLSFLMQNSLEMQGIVYGAEVGKRLHLIFYYGARQHYFEQYRPDVERMAESIRFIKNPEE